MIEGLVSIIVPVYNNEKYIEQTIRSVQAQTYQDWEMLMIDDCSTDSGAQIIQKLLAEDRRLKYFRLETNSGAAIARNTALENAKGQYIAYLDADDLWLPIKLEKQINFIRNNLNVGFTCCDYNKIDSDGMFLNKIIHMPQTLTYKKFLRNTIIQTSGVMVDITRISSELLKMPNIRRGQDAATWAQILKAGNVFYGQNEVLAAYRRVEGSLSSNKLKAVKRTWYWYRKVEKLNFFYAFWCFIGYAFHASMKRIYKKKSTNINVNVYALQEQTAEAAVAEDKNIE